MMPIASAPAKERTESHNVATRPCPNKGRYSTIVRKLKLASISGSISQASGAMADRHGRKRANRVTARDPTLLVVFLPGVGVDPIVEVLLQTAVEGGLIKEEVHPDQQVLRVVARGEGERFLRQHFRHDRERPGWVSGRLPLDRRDVVDAAISLAVVDGVEQERAAALVALDVGIGEGSLGVLLTGRAQQHGDLRASCLAGLGRAELAARLGEDDAAGGHE